MMKISEVFYLHRAKSGLLSEYSAGHTPYIGNGLTDNAVAGLVTPKATDKVFRFRGIVVSAFCEATVQQPPYVACGRAGNGLVVLEPRVAMSLSDLAQVAAYINLAVKWRFNWYRQVTVDRLKPILARADKNRLLQVPSFASCIPQVTKRESIQEEVKLLPFSLGDIYDLKQGALHSVSDLERGETPIVSCGDRNNGVIGRFSVSRGIHKSRLTVAANGDAPLTSKFHPYEFAAKDDVVVCLPKMEIRLTTELFIQMMLNRERWRFSYYRKCYLEKMKRIVVNLPVLQGDIDEDIAEAFVKASPYWKFLSDQVAALSTIS